MNQALIDGDATKYPVFAFFYDQKQKTLTQEFNISSLGGGPFKWAAGFYYYNDKTDTDPLMVRGLFVNPSQPNTFYIQRFDSVRTQSYAGFGDFSYEVFPRLFLTGGIRYTHETLKAQVQFVPAAPIYNQKSFESVTPRAVIRYNFAENSNVYASYSKGFKSGGFTPSDSSTPGHIPSFEPEKLDAYEIGFKTKQRLLTLEGATFLYKYSDQQTAYYVPGGARTFNAASSTIYGAELQATVKPSSSLCLSTGLAYQHARYDKFPNAQSVLVTGPVTVDASGTRIQRAPDFTGNVSVNYSHNLGDGRVETNASYYYTTKFGFDPSNTYVQNGYGLLSARVSYIFPGKHFSVSVYGNNLTDKTYTASILQFPGLAILQQYGTPRTYGAEFGFRF